MPRYKVHGLNGTFATKKEANRQARNLASAAFQINRRTMTRQQAKEASSVFVEVLSDEKLQELEDEYWGTGAGS